MGEPARRRPVLIGLDRCLESIPGASRRTVYRLMRKAGAACGPCRLVLA